MPKPNRLLIAILILATVLRFYKLGQIPPSLDWDETAHGYNAYSILKTGRDEYGYKFPLSFRSFDDYKPPIYTYLVVPSVAFFGLNDFAVRFPSALLGVLAVLFTYLAVLELFKNRSVALLSALFLAISPWHLQFSRVAFETNSATFWSVLGTWAFLKGVSSRKMALWLSLAALAFGINLFTYHNARVFVPLYTPVILFLYRKPLFVHKKNLIAPIVISGVFLVLLFPIVTSISGQLRYQGTTIFADLSPKYKTSNLLAQDKGPLDSTLGKIFHNRRFVYLPILYQNYLSNFNPSYLLFNADLNRHHAPQMGLLYLWDLPFIILGTFYLLSENFDNKSKIIIFWWFLMAPVAASVTWGVPHALRSEIYLPIYQILIAVGVYTFFLKTNKKRLFVLVASFPLLVNFLFYLHQYYVHLPVEYSEDWLYGRKQAATTAENLKGGYDRVIVSTRLQQPHEFWLYYLKYDPAKYLGEGGTISGGYLEDRNKFDKYFFKNIDYINQKNEAKTLFVSLAKKVPPDAHIIKTIYYLNGKAAITLFD